MSGTIAVHSIQDPSRGIRAYKSSLRPAGAEAPLNGHAWQRVPGRSRRAPAPHEAELGTSSDGLSFIAFGERADHAGSEDMIALRRAMFVRP